MRQRCGGDKETGTIGGRGRYTATNNSKNIARHLVKLLERYLILQADRILPLDVNFEKIEIQTVLDCVCVCLIKVKLNEVFALLCPDRDFK